MAKPQYEFILDVRLRTIRPPIVRRLRVPGRLKLKQLHGVLQLLFGWRDCHLHEFKVRGQRFGDPEYLDSDVGDWVTDEVDVRLDTVLGAQTRCVYRYDFGDCWEVAIQVVERRQCSGMVPVVCETGERAGPPEDCGGLVGYTRLVTALKDDGAPHTWVGHASDPEVFDIEQVNRKLARQFPGGRKEPVTPTVPEPYDPSTGPPGLEHYAVERLNLRDCMLVLLRQAGPLTLADLEERLADAGVAVRQGRDSLLKAWRRQPPIRQKADGRLEIDTDHPAWRQCLRSLDGALPRPVAPEPPPEPQASVDTDTPLTWAELERAPKEWPFAWSLRRRLMMVLDATGQAMTKEAALAALRALVAAPETALPSSFSGRGFNILDEGRASIDADSAEVRTVRGLLRTWVAKHTPRPVENPEIWKARQTAWEEGHAEEGRRFLQARKAILRTSWHGNEVAACLYYFPEGRVVQVPPGKETALRERVRDVDILVGLDPKADVERLGLEGEGLRCLDVSPPSRSMTVDGRQMLFSVPELISMTVPSDLPLSMPEASWAAGSAPSLMDALERDVRLLYTWYRYGVEHAGVRRWCEGEDELAPVLWDIGREGALGDVLNWAVDVRVAVEIAVRPWRSRTFAYPLRAFLPTDIRYGVVTGRYMDGEPAEVMLAEIVGYTKPDGCVIRDSWRWR